MAYGDLDETIERRNQRLVDYFKKSELNIEVKILNKNNPIIIVDEVISLNCHVSNFQLNFVDEMNGETVKSIKLQKDANPDDGFLRNFIDLYPQKRLFRIQYDESPLFICGYNFLDKNDKASRYPVFSSKGFKVYFNKEHAEEICSSHQERCGGKLKVV